MRSGISSFTYTWAVGVPGTLPDNPMSPFDMIRMASKLRADCVQIADNMPLHLLPDNELHALSGLSGKLGIPVEVGARGMTPENLARYLEIAEKFQSPILRMVISNKDFNPSLDKVHGIIKEFIPELRSRNIILAIENYEKFPIRDFVTIIEKAGSEYTGVCLDTVNSMGTGEGLDAVIEYLAPLTVNLHVKEFIIRRMDHQMGFVIEGAPLGKGMLPLQNILEKIQGRCQSAILEQWVSPENTMDKTIEKEALWAEESFNYLKTLLLST
ncbi:MAG: hypothetical protein AMS27_14780 [Bacteroides sp. SM23_62_1]|nr:MAG: hypothetical protein AMS27_14780 [Bacteroides sp. SM23_62_1]